MDMTKVFQLRGRGRDIYFVKTTPEWLDITYWMRQNNVEYNLWESSTYGYGFKVFANKEWFALRWA
jgi:hypothetical protein